MVSMGSAHNVGSIALHVADKKVVGWTNKRRIASASCLSRIDIAGLERP
jgi:hypothetical protein